MTDDLTTVWNILQALRREEPTGGTNYVPPLDMIRDEFDACADCGGRKQRVLFMSDGQPNSVDEIPRAAQDLADRGIVADTFRLGNNVNPAMLILIADTTDGAYFPLATPGEILRVLPEIALQHHLSSRHDGTGEIGEVVADSASKTFQAPVVLQPGSNRIFVVLETLDSDPVVLECPIDLDLSVPRPEDVGGALRLAKDPARPFEVQLIWSGAPDPLSGQDYRLFRALDREGPFRERGRTTVKRWEAQRWPLDELSFYDVRSGNCLDSVSYDPYPAVTRGLSVCWTPPDMPPLYPFASNLTDPACGNAISDHPCPASPPLLEGAERAFPVEVENLGTELGATLGNQDLTIVLYDPDGLCVAWGQGGVEVRTERIGTYTLIVDSPAGGEGPFDLVIELE